MFFTVSKASKHHSYDYIWLLINYFNEKLKFLSASSNDTQKVTKTCLEKNEYMYQGWKCVEERD